MPRSRSALAIIQYKKRGVRRDRQYTCRGGQPCPPSAAVFWRCVGAGLSCPPSWPPIGWHFLKIASLLPPPAALRRFPRPQATSRAAPTECSRRCGTGGRGRTLPLRTVTSSAVGRADVGIGPYGRLQVVRWGGTMWASSPTKNPPLGEGRTDCHGRFAPSQ